MRNSLLISDLHLTSAERDEYRWRIFQQVFEFSKQKNVERLFILGDLTNEKDGHPATLVNRIVDELCRVLKTIPEVVVLRGNHDGIDPSWPYFAFLNKIGGLAFVVEPKVMTIDKRKVLLLPHSRNPTEDWRDLKSTINLADYILMHNTVSGAVAETGVQLRTEIPADIFAETGARIYSGDVHVPQKIANVRYVGSPYHVRFGDSFEPRMVYLDENEKQKTQLLTNVKKVTIDAYSVAEAEAALDAHAHEEIHVKIRLHLKAVDIGRWHEARSELAKACKKRELKVAVLELVKHQPESSKITKLEGRMSDPVKVLDVFVASEGIDSASVKLGRDLLSSCLPSRK